MAAELPALEPALAQQKDPKPTPPLFTVGPSTVQLSHANHTLTVNREVGALAGDDSSSSSSNGLARRLLRDVKKDVEDEEETARRKSPKFHRRHHVGNTSPGPEHYAKMGILIPRVPETRQRSHTTTPQGSLKTNSFDAMEGEKHLTLSSRARSKHTSGTPPVQLPDDTSLDDNAPSAVGLRPRSGAIRPVLDDSPNPSPPPPPPLSSSPSISTVVQPSPPVCVAMSEQQRSVMNEEEEEEGEEREMQAASSPDSGYGNTPEYGGGGTATGSSHAPTDGSSVSSQRRTREATRTKEGQLQRKRSGAILEGVMPQADPITEATPASGDSNPSAEDPRTRGDTQDSVGSASDGSCVMVELLSEPSLSEVAVSQPQVSVDQPSPLDPALSHYPHLTEQPLRTIASVPDNLCIGMGPGEASPEHLPFHMSPSTYGNGSESRSHSSSSSSGYYSSRFSSDFSTHVQQLHEAHHPHHPHHPHRSSLNAPQKRHLTTSRRHGSHHYGTPQPEERRDNLPVTLLRRTNSQPMAKLSELRSLTASSQEEKDYFQVTDDLAKENAHFALSEALLTVVEQYKSNTEEELSCDQEDSLPPQEPCEGGEGGEGGGEWGASRSPSVSSFSVSHGLTPPYAWGGPPHAGGPSSFSSWGSRESLNSNYEYRSPRRAASRVSLLELIQSSAWDNSAESTAQKLLQHVAQNLTGSRVAESGSVSQMALQLPTDFLAALKMDEDLQRSVTTSLAHMRGNREWAPPRRQIIFHVKSPSKNLAKDMSLQGYRCTGCGMKVTAAHARYFRFCHYTGKYFCQNCHHNATALIPAHIIDRWAFRKMPVSNFARDLLSKVHYEPLFNVQTVNHQIYSRIPIMQQAKELRTQLISIKQYLKTCRRGQSLHMSFDGFAPWTTDLHLYSINDFLELKSGVKMRHLRSMLSDAIAHVKTCPLCQGKGFVCEFCDKSNDIIYPFEIYRVSACPECSCCFHRECFRNQKQCPRCQRMLLRQKQRIQKTLLEADQSEDGNGSHVEQPS